MHAAIALRTMGPAASKREADRNVLRALDEVSQRLGNTRTVCRKYYVHPALLEAYYEGRTIPASEPASVADAHPGRRVRAPRGAALRRDETAVLQFLQDSLDRARRAEDSASRPRPLR